MANVDNYWEQAALEEYQYANGAVPNPLFHSQLYSTSGIDLMGLLGCLVNRQNPRIDTRDINLDWAMIICDLKQKDQPILYCSPGFTNLTGYTLEDIKGKNCRFLQAPGGKVRPKSPRAHISKETIRTMKNAVETNKELEIDVVNFKKDGTKFINRLTIIPIRYRSRDYDLTIGFQREPELLGQMGPH